MKNQDDKSSAVLSPPIRSVARQTKAFLRARHWPLLVGQAAWLAAALLILAVTMVAFKGWNRSAAIHGVAAAGAPTAVSDGMWLASEIEKQRLVPYILANDPDVVTALISGPRGQASLATARAALNRKLEMLCDGTTAGVIFVLDASGKSVAASNWNTKQSFVGVDYAFRPYYKLVRQGEAVIPFSARGGPKRSVRLAPECAVWNVFRDSRKPTFVQPQPRRSWLKQHQAAITLSSSNAKAFDLATVLPS
jgi:hypothetical protein